MDPSVTKDDGQGFTANPVILRPAEASGSVSMILQSTNNKMTDPDHRYKLERAARLLLLSGATGSQVSEAMKLIVFVVGNVSEPNDTYQLPAVC